MTKFMLKCFFTTTVLFLGVLIGIQVASNSMVKMTGDQHYSTETVVKKDQGVQAHSVSSAKETTEELTSHDLEGKQAKLEKIETFNLFSQVGALLSDGLNVVFSKLLTKITATIGDILT